MDNYGAGGNKYTDDDFNRALGYENTNKQSNDFSINQ